MDSRWRPWDRAVQFHRLRELARAHAETVVARGYEEHWEQGGGVMRYEARGPAPARSHP